MPLRDDRRPGGWLENDDQRDIARLVAANWLYVLCRAVCRWRACVDFRWTIEDQARAWLGSPDHVKSLLERPDVVDACHHACTHGASHDKSQNG